MSPSLAGLYKLIHICESFGLSHDVLFNNNNSMIMSFRAGNLKDTHLPLYTLKPVFHGACFGAVSAPTLYAPYPRRVRPNPARIKPGVHTNDFAPIYGRRAKKLGHASLTTVFRHSRLTFQPILRENLESPKVSANHNRGRY